MPTEVVGTFVNDKTVINQYKYSQDLYQKEVLVHHESLQEYKDEILDTILETMNEARPNVKLYENQPYITSVVRHKLIDFLLRMAIRLKIVPYVFCRAVRLFDRYCAKRIVLLDQAQLVMTTCLWIAAKIHGGNNHFANLSTPKAAAVKTILNLGYGAGARFLGPTERYRLPKVIELVKLCGTRCNYDEGMFKQMEIHIMQTLDWKLNDTSIDDFLVSSEDLSLFPTPIVNDNVIGSTISRTRTTSSTSSASSDGGSESSFCKSTNGGDSLCSPIDGHDLGAEFNDVPKVKEFLAYAACYLFELVKYSPLELAQMCVNLINDVFQLDCGDVSFVTINQDLVDDSSVNIDFRNAREIRRHLVRAIVNAPAYLLRCFDSPGPRFVYAQVTRIFRAHTAGATFSLGGLDVGSSQPLSQPIQTNQQAAALLQTPSQSRFPLSYSASPSLPAPNSYTYAPPEKFTAPTSFHSSGLQDQLRTPVRESVMMTGSHHYPSAHTLSLHQPPCKNFYMRSNNSLGSVGSNGSSRLDLYHDSAKNCLATPMSIDDDKCRLKKKIF